MSRFAKSIRQARTAMFSWYGLAGTLVAGVALLNFVQQLLALNLDFIVEQLLVTYQAIVHGAIDWLTWPLQLHFSGWFKDTIFLYVLTGGAFMRARLAEGIYLARKPQPVRVIAKFLLRPDREWGAVRIPGESGLRTGSRLQIAYGVSPKWLQMAFDLLLWPRVARQYWTLPMVHFHEYGGTYQRFRSGYVPGPRKPFLYDRRLVFGAQLVGVLSVTAFILIINGFLVMPKP